MAPELQNFHEKFRILFVRKYEQTEKITKNEMFLESLKEYVWIFSKHFEQLFNFANSIVFSKWKNCFNQPEKICMYSFTNFKNFLCIENFFLESNRLIAKITKNKKFLKLVKEYITKRIFIFDSLLKRNKTDPFLKRIITGDEKWVVYDNVVRKRSLSKRDEPVHNRYQKWIFIERRLCFMYCLFWAAPKEPNYQFECLLSKANEIGQRNKEKAARTGKS